VKKGGEAVAATEAAVKAHPDSAVLVALRGYARAKTGAKPAAVRADYQRALELDPAEHRALVGLAALEAEAGSAESALGLYERAAEGGSERPRDDPRGRQTARPARPIQRCETRLTNLAARVSVGSAGRDRTRRAAQRARRGSAATRELARRAVMFGGGEPAKALLERVDGQAGGATPAPTDQGASDAG
jgi:hypothetical protein